MAAASGLQRVEALQLDGLSAFERRCLLKHIRECHELVQLTLLGAASANDKVIGDCAVARIQEALRAAELQIAEAERLAFEMLTQMRD